MKNDKIGKSLSLLIIALSLLLLSMCSGGSAGDDTATISISLSTASAAGKAAVSIDDLTHVITLTGPAEKQTLTSAGSGTVRASVFPGLWHINVEGYYGKDLYSVGSASAEVKSRQNTNVSIQMTVVYGSPSNGGGGGGGGGWVGGGVTSKADPVITTWPSGLMATVGQTLGDISLTGGVSVTPGVFKWTSGNATSVGSVGNNTHNVTFEPSDTAAYNTLTQDVTVMVVLATVSIALDYLGSSVNMAYPPSDPGFPEFIDLKYVVTFTRVTDSFVETITKEDQTTDAILDTIALGEYNVTMNIFLRADGSLYASGGAAAPTPNPVSITNGKNDITVSVTIDPGVEGDGSPANPFKLYDAAALQRVGTEPTGTGNWSLDAYYALIQDITLPDPSTLGGSNFTAIGDNSTPFTGNFDGKGYKISNLIINESMSDYQGLFGYVDTGGVVVNLGMDGGSITANEFIGGIAGVNNGTVENCYNTGTISGLNEAGGVVGQNGGSIQDCYATGNVNGQGNVGGVAGSSGIGNFVQNCYATGNVTGTSTTIGGVVGNNGGTVENCYATGDVSGYTSIGGVVGSNSFAAIGGTVQYCYATGSVSGAGNVGGVVGNNPLGTSTVQNCVALNSKVTLSTSAITVARVVGINSGGTLTDNYARGDLVPVNLGGPLSVSPGLTDPNGDDFTLNTSLATVFDSGWSAWNNTSGNLAIGGALPTLAGVGGTQNPTLPSLLP